MPAPPLQSEFSHTPRNAPPGAVVKCASVVWLMLVVFGMLGLTRSANQAAPPSQAVSTWPINSNLSGPSGSSRLLVFLHPKCGCNVATVRQLATLQSQSSSDLAVTAVFYWPEDQSIDWVHSDLWDRCLQVPGISCIADRGGSEAARFGVSASGHVLLFDRSGTRRFDGGITTARAHEGHGFGAEALRMLLNGENPDRVTFPVFGCAIHVGRIEDNKSLNENSK